MDKVLIVDDDRFMQGLLQKSLFNTFDVRTADDGRMGVRVAREWLPNVIVLDVEMPGCNGYETCEILKQDPVTQDIPIIFLSSRSSVRERMLGLEMGADDYLEKPCAKEILLAKITRLGNNARQTKNLRVNASLAEQTAREALATSFELGKAVRFAESVQSARNLRSLGEILARTLKDMDLKVTAMVLDGEAPIFISSHSERIKPLEMELVQLLHTNGRFIDFGCRTQVNFSRVAVLIKNMPLNDRARYGRIKDTVPFLLGVSDARISVLTAEQALYNQNQKLLGFVHKLQTSLTAMNGHLEASHSQLAKIMADLSVDLMMRMQGLGLEPDQEEHIQQRVEAAMAQLHELLDAESDVHSIGEKMVGVLRSVAQEQEQILKSTLAAERSAVEPLSDAVELF